MASWISVYCKSSLKAVTAGKLAAGMPVTFGENSLKVQDTRGFFAAIHHAWWKIPSNEDLSSGVIGTTGVPDALVEEIESPYASGRTVVLASHASAAHAFSSRRLDLRDGRAVPARGAA